MVSDKPSKSADNNTDKLSISVVRIPDKSSTSTVKSRPNLVGNFRFVRLDAYAKGCPAGPRVAMNPASRTCNQTESDEPSHCLSCLCVAGSSASSDEPNVVVWKMHQCDTSSTSPEATLPMFFRKIGSTNRVPRKKPGRNLLGTSHYTSHSIQ